MDQELKLILKLEGQEKIKALAGIVGDVTKSLGERERAEKQLVKALKDTATAEELVHGHYKTEMALVKNLREVRSQAADAMQSDYAKMMKSYFTTGEEMRRYFQSQRLSNRIMSEASQTVNNFTNIIGGTSISNAFTSLTSNFQSLEFAVQGIAISATNAGGKMASFGNVLAGLAAPITILGAGVLFVANQFKELTKASDEASKSLAKTFMDSMQEYFNLTPKQMLEGLEKEREKIQKEIAKATAGLLKAEAFTASSAAEKIIKEQAILTYETALKKANEDMLRLEVRMKRLRKEATEKIGLGTAVPFPEDVELVSGGGYTRGPGFLGGLGTGVTGGRGVIPGMLRGVAPKPSSWGQADEVKVKFDELSTETRGLFTSMTAMADAASTHISNSLATGLREAFGEGKNLFEDMLLGFMSSLADFGIKEMFKEILSFVPGLGPFISKMAGGGIITEPMIARGMHTGRLVAIGESGPEIVTPMNRATGTHHASMNTETQSLIASVNMLARTIAGGAWKVRGTQLAYLQDKVSRIHQGMKM